MTRDYCDRIESAFAAEAQSAVYRHQYHSYLIHNRTYDSFICVLSCANESFKLTVFLVAALSIGTGAET